MTIRGANFMWCCPWSIQQNISSDALWLSRCSSLVENVNLSELSEIKRAMTLNLKLKIVGKKHHFCFNTINFKKKHSTFQQKPLVEFLIHQQNDGPIVHLVTLVVVDRSDQGNITILRSQLKRIPLFPLFNSNFLWRFSEACVFHTLSN